MKNVSATPLFFLTRSLFFGLGISLICKYTDKDTYIGAILGMFLGLCIILAYRYIIRAKKCRDLKQIFAQHKTIGTITRTLLLIASIIILIYTLLTYKTFVSSFLLATTPVYMILIPCLLLLIYASSNGLSMIHKLATALLPISITLSFLSIISIFVFDYQGYWVASNILTFIAGLISWVSVFFILFRKDGKGIHDLLAKTRVVGKEQ